MKNLHQNLMRLSVVLLGLGMLAAVGCESCTPSNQASTADIPTQTSYKCGPGTTQVGLKCVNNAGPSPTQRTPVDTVPVAGN